MSQFLRPDGDKFQGVFMDEPEESPYVLWNDVDEVNYNDSDYIWANGVGINSLHLWLSNPAQTPGSGTHVFRVRAARIDGGKDLKMVAYIRHFPSDALIFSKDFGNLTDQFVTYEHILTQGEVDNITGYDVLFVYFWFYASGGGKAPDPAISWVEFEIPDYVPTVMMII